MNYSTLPRFLLTADWIFPVSTPPIRDGGLLINKGKIEAVLTVEAVACLQKEEADLPHEHYKNAAILPGLINLHTHLDYSNLAHLSDFNGADMFDWLENLIELSRCQLNGPEALAASALSGAREAALAGTSYVVDSTFSGASATALAAVGLKGLVGLEIFGLDEKRVDFLFGLWESRMETLKMALEAAEAEQLVKSAGAGDTAGGAAMPIDADDRLNSPSLKTQPISEQFLDKLGNPTPKIRLTIAPHAPYTVSPALWRRAKDWAQANGVPLTCHLSESENEHKWIGSDDERLHRYLLKVMPKNATISTDEAMSTFLKSLSWRGKGLTPVAHLSANNLLDKATIAAHCLKVSENDIEILGRAQVKVALCPRSNRCLKNGKPNARAYADRGVTFALGTDSKASCPNLNLLEEARLLNDHSNIRAEDFLSDERLLALLTIEAAKAVGLETNIGSLAPGKCADLAVFDIHPGADRLSAEAALADIFEQKNSCRLLLVDGRPVVSAGRLN